MNLRKKQNIVSINIACLGLATVIAVFIEAGRIATARRAAAEDAQVTIDLSPIAGRRAALLQKVRRSGHIPGRWRTSKQPAIPSMLRTPHPLRSPFDARP